MGKKDRTLPAFLDRSIREARVAGLSERSIYESLRGSLKAPPSYRDVRASFQRGGVETRAKATEARHVLMKERVALARERKQGPDSIETYHQRLQVVREIDRTPTAVEAVNRDYLLGYMARAGASPDDFEDEAFAEDLRSIYEGQGS